jgi:hypothetical protein
MNKGTMNMVIKAIDNATPTLRKIGKSFGTLKNAGAKLGSGMASVFSAVAKVGAVAVTALGAGVLYSVKQASDLNETLSKTKVVLGEASDEVIAFSESAASALGMSKTEALNAASTFAIFGKSANLSGDTLAGFSTELTTLAADFGSFYNASNEDAITAIGSALRGESEPIRKFGVLLNDATLRSRAFSMGLIKTTNEALTPQNKVLAAQAEILAQAAKTGATGDFQRTLGESLPNQLKVLDASFATLTTSFGEEFLPIALDVAKWATNSILPAFKSVMPVVKDFAKGAISTAGALGTKLMPIFRTVGDFIFTKLVPGISGFISKLVEPGGVIDSVGKVVGPIIGNLIPVFGQIFDAVGKTGAKIMELVGILWGDGNGLLAMGVQNLGNVLGFVGKIVANLIGFIGDAIGAVIRVSKAIMDSPIGWLIKQIAGFIGGVVGGVGGALGITPPANAGTGVSANPMEAKYTINIGGKDVDGVVKDSLGRIVTTTTPGR